MRPRQEGEVGTVIAAGSSLLITILIVLAIIALIVFIARR